MAGKKRVISMDYAGAVEAFEKALEVNPRSGAAHFELACLYEERQSDPAAAIYHYQSYLRLRPDAGNASVVKQRITTCKQELARNVSLGPLTERQQRELEQLVEENKKLTLKVKDLQDQLANWSGYAARLSALTNPAGAAPISGRSAGQVLGNSGMSGTAPAGAEPGSLGLKTHTVKAGENATTIARQYGVKVANLLSANPRVDWRRLKVGQTLTVPLP